VRGLWWAYFGGPALSKVRTGTQILLGLPFAEAEGVIESIEANFSAAEGRIVIRDVADTNIVRTYFYPIDAGLAVNDTTGLPIAEGETIAQFDPLSGGIEVLDYIKDPLWAKVFVDGGRFLEIEKYFKFLVRGDVDTFSLTNMVFAIDFVKKIKPHYTFPLFVFLKNVQSDGPNVVDQIEFNVLLRLLESPCLGSEGSYNWDSTDESGGTGASYDDAPPQFVYDTKRLCPGESLIAIVSAPLSSGPWSYDSIWAYDDGDTDGIGGSDDLVPLSGPAPTPPPPPNGPLVGVINFDDTKAAGTYTRSRRL
jgi:hypothetical protein